MGRIYIFFLYYVERQGIDNSGDIELSVQLVWIERFMYIPYHRRQQSDTGELRL